jgi:hypothetical protein
MIISASRRTDIPAYYSQWFLNRLKAGYVITRNPMNPKQVSRISLSPEAVDCIVFWTKDPMPMMDKLPEIDSMGYSYYFQFTLTPYGRDIERNLREKREILRTFQQLSGLLGKERIVWRYDPIVMNASLTIPYHLQHFERMCGVLSGYTSQCTISFVDLYSKLSKIIKKNIIREIGTEEMLEIAERFSSIAQRYGIELRSCSEKLDLSQFNILPAACIDKTKVEEVCGHPITWSRDRNQRPGCGCMKSVDIGVYNTCRNGCIYCYANHSDASIEKNCKRHDSKSDILIGTISYEESMKKL